VKTSYWEICPGAANAAGQNLTLSLVGQYGKNGIGFIAVNPGPVRTERRTGLVEAMSRDMEISFEETDTLAPRPLSPSAASPKSRRSPIWWRCSLHR